MKTATRNSLTAMLAATLSTLVSTGCQTTTVIKNPATPMFAKGAEIASIAVSKVGVDTTLLDQRIGASRQGLVQIPISQYTVAEAMGPCAQAPQELEMELTAAGYRVIRQSGLFQEGSAKSAADFMVGGNLRDISFNSYDSVAGVSSKAKVTIEWQLFDNRISSVVYTNSTFGEAKGPKDSPGTILGAIKGSFRKTLEDPQFQLHLTAKSGSPIPAAQNPSP